MSALAALRRLVGKVLSRTRYDGLYPATVQGVNGDGSLDVLPDDELFRGTGLTVPVDSDPPNTTIVPTRGARCLVGFKASDPRRPYVAEWESGIERVGLDGGTRGLARLSDEIEIAMPASVTVTGVVQGTQTIPGTPPTIVPIPPTPLVGGVAVVAPPPRAIVQTGNPKLLA